MILMKVKPRPLALFLALTLPSLFLLFWSEVACAVEVAPRITDREIIQELITIKTDLKAGQDKTNQRFDDINKRFDDINLSFNKRIDDTNRRFDDVNKRFDDVNKRFDDINKRFDESTQSVNKRIDDISQSLGKRLDDLHHLILTMFGSLLGVMIALIGFIFWDRRTTMKPLEKRIEDNTNEIDHNTSKINTHQELLQNHSSLLNQFLLTLRELAKKDPELSIILRNYSLL